VKAKTVAILAAAAMASAAPSGAQTRVAPRPLPGPVAAAPAVAPQPEQLGLRRALGPEQVLRLLRSTSDDDVVRGIERLEGLDSPEAFTLLVRAAGASGGAGGAEGVAGCARRNPRALLEAVRALSPFVDKEPARRALLEVLNATSQQLETAGPAASNEAAAVDPSRAPRLQLARQEAALALAASGSPLTEEKLVDVVRSEGPGQAAALAALMAYPPESPTVLGGVALTARAMVGLAGAIGDLRALDGVLGLVRTSDPALRSAALLALGDAGDARGVDAAREAVHDPAAIVRVAAAEALARLGVAGADAAVEGLIADDTTALEGLRLARRVQGEGVTRAVAARAAASSELALRTAALEALGSQTSPAAVAAIVELGRSPLLRGDAADALARSPSDAAMPALEAMAGRPAEARMAGRAYFVRRRVHGARSPALDALLARLASSTAPGDRAVGMEALVALGERSLDGALADADPGVRAAAAMGAAAHLDARASRSLLARMAVESDPATRTVLALGLLGADDPTLLAGTMLLDRVRSGATDAPFAAMALARRSVGAVEPDVASLLESHDAVMRAYVARGLGASAAPDASGLLARAYEGEVDPTVRRAIVEALASRRVPLGPWAEAVLRLAARLDPERDVRVTADRLVRGAPPGKRASTPEVAWMNLVAAEGASLTPGATALIVDADGRAWPVAFDEDGVALAPGVEPRRYQVRLAPRMPTYSPSTP
jgi:hypothetical protein